MRRRAEGGQKRSARAARALERARRPGYFSRFTLAIGRRLAGPLARFGVEPRAFLLLLELRLRLDERTSRGDVAARARGFVLNAILFLLMGVVLGFVAAAISDPFWAMTAVQGGLFAFLSMAFAMQIGSLLFDRAEAAVVACTPVTARTALYARLVHGGAFVGGLGVVLVVPPLLIGLGTHAPLAWIPGLLVCSLVTLVTSGLAIALLMLLVARRVRPGRVQSVVVWVQMVFLGSFYASLQILGPLLKDMSDRFEVQRGSALMLLFPPAWSGGLYALLEGQVVGVHGLVLAGLALAAPALLARLVARRVHASLWEDVLAVDGGGAARGRWRSELVARIARPGAERQGFLFMRRMALRENAYRLRTWPAAVYPVAALAGMWVQGGSMLEEGWVFGLGAYLSAVIAPALILHADGAEDHDASWVFDAQPTGDPAQVVAGARKALVAYTSLLPCLVLAVLALAVGGWSAGLTTLIAGGGAVSAVLVLAIWLPQTLPFSRPPSSGAQMDQLGWYLLALLAAGLAAGAQLSLSMLPFARPLLLPLFWVLAGCLWWRLGALRTRARRGPPRTTTLPAPAGD
jgi:hypothetical protein